MTLDQIPVQALRLPPSVSGEPVRHQWQALPPLSLYIHIPWCVQKCPYCDFNSHQQNQATVSMDDYLATLIQDLDQQLPSVWGRPLHSIFIGGGTPSLMTPEQVDGLLSQVRSRLPFNDRTEVTLEANPGAVDSSHFVGYRQAGVTRISLGVQSFHAPHLQALGRIHSAEDAHQAILAIQAADFQRWNVDLMFGLPQQTVAQGLDDVDTLLAYEPSHVSYYQLTLEPNTPFYRSPPPLPTEDAVFDLQEAAMVRWQQVGLQPYEVSAMAQPGQHSQHNTNYWLFGDYLGIGAGAHGKLSFANDGRLCRTQHVAAPGAYVAAVKKAAITNFSQAMATTQRDVSVADTVFEYALNAVRLKQGVAWPHFERVAGLPVELLQQKAQWAQEKGLLETSATHLVTTDLGWAQLNEIQASFLPG